MHLTHLEIHQVRNIQDVKIKPDIRCNYIFGDNASGKTSLLEAIYLLSIARSFRTTHIKHVISHDKQVLRVFARVNKENKLDSTPVGIERSFNKTRIRINGIDVKQISELTSLLPVQIINPDVHKLLEQGPKYRRQFIDWGVFHVEHDYLANWRAFHRVLQQRNAALRQHQSGKQISAWDKALVEEAMVITRCRQNYLAGLLPILQDYSQQLIQQQPVLSYQQGWPTEESLHQLLVDSLPRDRERGHTQYGPHRAELVFKFNGVPAQEILSRGQTKLFISAMQLAQVSHLAREQGVQCVVMIDDLAAELDRSRRAALIDLLLSTQAQVFITVTEPSLLDIAPGQGHKMFHVEQGRVQEVVV